MYVLLTKVLRLINIITGSDCIYGTFRTTFPTVQEGLGQETGESELQLIER